MTHTTSKDVTPMPAARKHSPNFFNREADGDVRVRLRFDPDEASLYEEAAGDEPVMLWLHRTLNEAANAQVRSARQERLSIAPPE